MPRRSRSPKQHDVPDSSAYAYQEASSLVPAIEGAELLALQGATRMLGNTALAGVIEFHPRAVKRAGAYERFLPTLRSYGFRLHEIRTDGQPVERTDTELVRLAEQKDGVNLFVQR